MRFALAPAPFEIPLGNAHSISLARGCFWPPKRQKQAQLRLFAEMLRRTLTRCSWVLLAVAIGCSTQSKGDPEFERLLRSFRDRDLAMLSMRGDFSDLVMRLKKAGCTIKDAPVDTQGVYGSRITLSNSASCFVRGDGTNIWAITICVFGGSANAVNASIRETTQYRELIESTIGFTFPENALVNVVNEGETGQTILSIAEKNVLGTARINAKSHFLVITYTHDIGREVPEWGRPDGGTDELTEPAKIASR